MKLLTPRILWNHETIDTTKPIKPWNHGHHETYETMKRLTPRNLWSHETIDTTKPKKPWNHWHHETHETLKPLTPRNLWNHETIDTTEPMKPRNTWNYETTDTTRPMKPWLYDTIIIWHRHWHILIRINSCTVTPSNNLWNVLMLLTYTLLSVVRLFL